MAMQVLLSGFSSVLPVNKVFPLESTLLNCLDRIGNWKVLFLNSGVEIKWPYLIITHLKIPKSKYGKSRKGKVSFSVSSRLNTKVTETNQLHNRASAPLPPSHQLPEGTEFYQVDVEVRTGAYKTCVLVWNTPVTAKSNKSGPGPGNTMETV